MVVKFVVSRKVPCMSQPYPVNCYCRNAFVDDGKGTQASEGVGGWRISSCYMRRNVRRGASHSSVRQPKRDRVATYFLCA